MLYPSTKVTGFIYCIISIAGALLVGQEYLYSKRFPIFFISFTFLFYVLFDGVTLCLLDVTLRRQKTSKVTGILFAYSASRPHCYSKCMKLYRDTGFKFACFFSFWIQSKVFCLLRSSHGLTFAKTSNRGRCSLASTTVTVCDVAYQFSSLIRFYIHSRPPPNITTLKARNLKFAVQLPVRKENLRHFCNAKSEKT